MFLSCCFPLTDTDFWWHLKTGELMFERGTIPHYDWYTYIDSDKRWIDLHWGFQLLITSLHWLGGVNLIIVVKAGLLTAALAIAIRAASRDLPASWIPFCWWLPIIAISGRGYIRPEVLSLLFLACWLWIGANVEHRPRWIWALIPLQILWVNCHAIFVLGLVVGGCFGIDFLIRRGARGRFGLDPLDSNLPGSWVGMAAGLAALASFVNPYFHEGAFFPLVLYRKFSVDQAFYTVNIGEFQQPIAFLEQLGWRALRNIYFLAQALLWFVTAVSFGLLLLKGRWSPYRWLLFIGFSHLAWEATRNTNIFALVAGWLLATNLSQLRRMIREQATEREARPTPGARGEMSAGPIKRRRGVEAAAEKGSLGDSAESRTSRRELVLTFAAHALLLSSIFVVVFVGQWFDWSGEGRRFGFGEKPDWYSHAAAQFAGQPGMPRRAFIAHTGHAEVYIYHNGPEAKVYMDSRLEVCTLQSFQQYNAILDAMGKGDLRWINAVRDEKGELPVIILTRPYYTQIGMLGQTPGWRVAFYDAISVVFVDEQIFERLGLQPVALPRR